MVIICCVVALGALGGLYLAIRARAIRGRKHPEVSSEVSPELIRRADSRTDGHCAATPEVSTAPRALSSCAATACRAGVAAV
jgi:hypothetical protein